MNSVLRCADVLIPSSDEVDRMVDEGSPSSDPTETCTYEVRAETAEEAVQGIAEHARRRHGGRGLPPAIANRARELLQGT